MRQGLFNRVAYRKNKKDGCLRERAQGLFPYNLAERTMVQACQKVTTGVNGVLVTQRFNGLAQFI